MKTFGWSNFILYRSIHIDRIVLYVVLWFIHAWCSYTLPIYLFHLWWWNRKRIAGTRTENQDIIDVLAKATRDFLRVGWLHIPTCIVGSRTCRSIRASFRVIKVAKGSSIPHKLSSRRRDHFTLQYNRNWCSNRSPFLCLSVSCKCVHTDTCMYTGLYAGR